MAVAVLGYDLIIYSIIDSAVIEARENMNNSGSQCFCQSNTVEVGERLLHEGYSTHKHKHILLINIVHNYIICLYCIIVWMFLL